MPRSTLLSSMLYRSSFASRSAVEKKPKVLNPVPICTRYTSAMQNVHKQRVAPSIHGVALRGRNKCKSK